MARQKGPRELRLARFRGVLTPRKIDVPVRMDQMGYALGEPRALLRFEPDIQNSDLSVPALGPH